MLDFAWTVAEFGASDAMEETGLTRSTTIEALDALTELGLLRELPNASQTSDYRKGRPARRFEIRYDGGVIVGVDAGREHVTIKVADLRARELTMTQMRINPEDDQADRRRRILGHGVDDALGLAGANRADLVALCVGVPAPVNSMGASPRHRDGFWERMNPDLTEAFAWVPLTRIENDACLAAIAEGALGKAQGCRDYVALLAGMRLGAGVVVDGRLLRGAHGGVGEMVAFDHVEGVGSAYGLGYRIEELTSEAVATGTLPPGAPLAGLDPAHVEAAEVLALDALGDRDAHAIVQETGHVLARVVSVLGSMYDPRCVIVSGAIAQGIGPVISAAQEALPVDLDLPAPHIVASELGSEVVVLGAIAAAHETVRQHILDLRLSASSQRS